MALDYDYGGQGDYENTTPEELANIVASPPKPTTPSVADTLTQQILGQNLTSKWSGEGFGSAEKNAADMARILADAGITNIKDFGKIEKVIPAHEEYQPGGESQEGSMVTVPEQTVTAFGNKKTGQELANTYGERQTGDFFGGTYAGKGNTGYGVQFKPDGTPVFYTRGASSNDLVNLLAGDPLLGAIAQAGAAYFGGPLGTAALNAAMGKSPEDILKSAALSYLGGQAGNFVSGAEGITDLLGDTGTKIAANAAKQFVGSGGQGVDPVKLLLGSGLVSGSGGVDGPNSADFEEGYFRPGGEGFTSTDAESTDNFLKSIGINSIDDLKDSGLSNDDIMNLVTGGYGDLTGLEDFVSAGDEESADTGEGIGEDTEEGTDEDNEEETTTSGGTGGNAGGAGKTTKTGSTGKTIKTSGTKTTGTKTTGTKTTGTKTTGTKTTGVTKTTNSLNSGLTDTGATNGLTTTDATTGADAAKTLAGILAGTNTTTAAKTAAKAKPTATTKNPAVDAVTDMAQQQQNQQTNLLNVMGGKDELAKIKSYKDLYGKDLFGDSYVPPSAGGDSEQEFFNGGHVDDLSVDALLHMLRN